MAAAPRSTPPQDLDAAAKAAWKRYRALLLERGVWDQSSPELLDELVRSLQDARAARARIATRAKDDPEGARWTRGSRNQLIAHPDCDLIRHALADAQQLGDRLLLTPSAARRAGVVTTGDAMTNPFASFVADELAPRRKRSTS